MFNDAQEQMIAQTARTTQRISIGMMMGFVVFGAVIFAVGLATDEPPELPLVTIIACVLTLMQFVVFAIVPNVFVTSARNSIIKARAKAGESVESSEGLGDVGTLVGAYQLKHIIGQAMLEGPAILNLLAYILEASVICLVLVAVLLLVMMFIFPTRDGIERFVRDQLTTIKQQQALAPGTAGGRD